MALSEYMGPYAPDVYTAYSGGEGGASGVINAISGLATTITGALQSAGVYGQTAQNVALGLPSYGTPTSYAQYQTNNLMWFVLIAGGALVAIVLLRRG